MKKTVVSLLVGMGLFAGTSNGQLPIITSMSSNGSLSWTNTQQTNAFYRVEWASSIDGPWRSSFQHMGGFQFNNCQAGTSEVFEVEIPMFYRVTMYTNTIPYGMVYIPGGTYSMGGSSTDTWWNVYSGPPHPVTLSPFWMSRTEVSWSEWTEVLNWATNNGYEFDNLGSNKAPSHPVCNMNWHDAVKWCNAKSEQQGRRAAYWCGVFDPTVYRTGQWDIAWYEVDWDGDGYRLPTEAEWEYAARGTLVSNRFPWGNTISWKQANYQSTGLHGTEAYDLERGLGAQPDFGFYPLPYTGPVSSFGQNNFGLFDMAGNLAEWCYDRFDNALYTNAPQVDPRGSETGSKRIVRGGSYMSESAAECSVYWRRYEDPHHHDWQVSTYMTIGFRYVVANP